MNKQRKVLITTTYNEMGIIIDTKVEEVAQTEVAKDTNVLTNDCISRQEAIDATWFELSYTDPLNVLTEVRDRLKALPPAQPENTRKRTESHACDLISRQAAVDAVKDRYYKYGRSAKVEELEWAIEALPSAQPEQRWIPCSEKEAEYPCLACDVFGQIFITNNGIVKINGECYDGTGFDFSNAEEFLKGIKVGNSMRMLPRKIVAWSPLPEPYKGDEQG